MNDVATEAMQIDTLGHDVGRNKYLWEEGTVERKHKALPGLTTGSPINQADIGKEHRAILSLVLIVAQCGDIAGLHCVDRAKQRLAFAGAAASLQELKKLLQHLSEAYPGRIAIGECSFDGRLVENFTFYGKVADEERRRPQKTAHDFEQQI